MLVLVCTLAAACAAIVTIARLQADATAARDAEQQLAGLRLALAQIQDVPWGASPDEGDDPAAVRQELEGAQQHIEGTLARLDRSQGLPERRAILEPFDRSMDGLWEIYDLASAGRLDETWEASSAAARHAARADAALRDAARRYRGRSVASLSHSREGSAAVILLLFGAFAWFYSRAARARRGAEALAAEKRRLLAASREEARTDALTGLRNRRALIADLAAACPDAGDRPVLLALFDLDGFKTYNDTFGHPAGDALLARLGKRLADTIDGIGTAYRMGGDEFCVLAPVSDGEADAVVRLAAAALAEAGAGFAIAASHGSAVLPADAATPEDALRCADQRMYAHKASARQDPARPFLDVLMRGLDAPAGDLASLAERTAARLGLDAEESEGIRLAARLHDVGKAAVPEAILVKRGELDADEQLFVRRHTLIGERIVRAAPALAHAADLVRWHHERLDGSGYPDGLRGHEIPLGARIIAVCDAFAAMVSERPYRQPLTVSGALEELRRNAGTQFDPRVVTAFSAAVREQLRVAHV